VRNGELGKENNERKEGIKHGRWKKLIIEEFRVKFLKKRNKGGSKEQEN
jgi:hypothetical protein